MIKHAAFALLAACCLLAGCSQDTVESAQEGTQDVAESVLTPKIKAALIANPILNEPENMIDVETDQGKVYLRGHVVSEEAKAEATQIAQRVLDESESKYELINELEIKVPEPEPKDGDSNDSSDGDGH